MAQPLNQIFGKSLSATAALRDVTAVDSGANLNIDDAATGFKDTASVVVSGAAALVVQAAFPANTDSVTVLPVGYDKDGTPIWVGSEIVIDASIFKCDIYNAAGTVVADQFVGAGTVDIVPGIHSVRLGVAAITTSGTVRLFLGYTSPEAR